MRQATAIRKRWEPEFPLLTGLSRKRMIGQLTDYSAVIAKIKASGSDIIYFGGYHLEMGMLLRQGAEQGPLKGSS